MNDESRPKAALGDLGEEVTTKSIDYGEDRWPEFGITDPLVARLDLSKDALRLYIVLAGYADGRTRRARPGQDRLARQLGWVNKAGRPERRRVYKALKALEEADVVRIDGQHSLGKGR